MTFDSTAVPVARICPACGGKNDPDAVFCIGENCRKALGDFRYVAEEEDKRWHESLAEKVTEFIGRPHFLVVHATWFAIWVLANTGLAMAMWRPFDQYPFGLLGIILTAEAILMTGFILISQNRQNLRAEKLAEIDYEISVRTYRRILELSETVERLEKRLDEIHK